MNIGIYLRSIGERTETLCYESIAQHIPKENIHIIKNIYPSYKAFWKMFRHARKQKYDWFLGIDADVVLREDWLSVVQTALNTSVAKNTFRVQFEVFDKITQQKLIRGNNWYNRRFLRKTYIYYALIYLCNLFFQVGWHLGLNKHIYTKPESFLINMYAYFESLPEIRFTVPLGWHGYEQTYAEIFRQYALRKHREPLFAKNNKLSFLDANQITQLQRNKDFERIAANLGWNNTKLTQRNKHIDGREILNIENFLEKNKIQKKSKLIKNLATFYQENPLQPVDEVVLKKSTVAIAPPTRP